MCEMLLKKKKRLNRCIKRYLSIFSKIQISSCLSGKGKKNVKKKKKKKMVTTKR